LPYSLIRLLCAAEAAYYKLPQKDGTIQVAIMQVVTIHQPQLSQKNYGLFQLDYSVL
jgi:hypothetical protein